MSKRIESLSGVQDGRASDGSRVPAALMRALATAVADLRYALDADQAAWRCANAIVTALPATGAVVILTGSDAELRVAAVEGIDEGPAGPFIPDDIDGWLDRALGEGWVSAPLPAPSRGVLAAAPSPGAQRDPELCWPLALLAATLASTLEAVAGDRRDSTAPPAQPGAATPRNHALRLALRGYSHDVRSPLQAIMMQASLLASGSLGELTDEQRAVLQDMREGLNSIRDTARASMEAGRVLAGEVELSPSTLGLDDLVADALAVARESVEAYGHCIEDRTDKGLSVTADGPVVVRVLCALLDNASKFCPRGGRIVVRSQRSAADDGLVEVTVCDSGPGVPDELVDSVFDPYVRATRADRAPGTGLGLTLARGLARALGGDLVLQRRDGRLACFTLSLPAG